MATNKTVLILGAGASRPYFFPTANELRKIIIGEQKLKQHFLEGLPHLARHSPAITHSTLIDSLGWLPSERRAVDKFIEAFRDSEFYSVDRFCFEHQEHALMAQRFIAGVLLQCEGFIDPGRNWLQQIWNDVISPGLNDGSPPLDIITFNYDRTLERYFEKVFRVLGKPRLQEERIHIHHVYGSLGPLKQVGYGDYGEVIRAAKHIKLMPPRTENNDALFDLLLSSDRAVFLGFGFDELNMKVLGIDANSRPAEIWASCYGLSATNKARAEETLGKIKWGDPNDTVQDFLHKGYIHR